MVKNIFSQRSISTFLTFYLSIAFMVIVGIVLPVSYTVVKNRTNREINIIADQYIMAVTEIIKEPIRKNDLTLIEDVVTSFESNPYINSIHIKNQNGSNIFSFAKNQTGNLIFRETTLQFPDQSNVILSVAISDYLFLYRNHQIFQIISFILVINLLLSFVTVWIISKFFIVKPLKQVINDLGNYLENPKTPRPETNFVELELFITSFFQLYHSHQNQIREKQLSQKKYKDLIDHASIGVFQSNQEGHFLSMNPTLAKMLGYNSPEDAILSIQSISTDVYANPEDRNRIIRSAIENDGHAVTEVTFKKRNGEHWQAKMNFRIIQDAETNHSLIEGFIEDVSKEKQVQAYIRKYQDTLIELVDDRTSELVLQNAQLQKEIIDRKKTEQALRESERRYRLLANHVNDVIWTINLRYEFTYISPSVEKLLGYTPAELEKLTIKDILSPESYGVAHQQFTNYYQQIKNKSPENRPVLTNEYEHIRKNGSRVWGEITTTFVTDENGNNLGFLGVTRDITERRKITNKLQELAITDSLTTLYNRRHFFDISSQEVERAKRYQNPISLIMIDLDFFKKVNDTYGHLGGDMALKKVAQIIKDTIRQVDIPARFGGEEFVILLPETNAEQAVQLAERLRNNVRENPLKINDDYIEVSISIGISSKTAADSISLEVLIQCADKALYEAKNSGRDQVQIFEKEDVKQKDEPATPQ